MCGIAGFLGFDDPNLLSRMARSLWHRGPDEEGTYQRPGIGLTMRRLAIIDLAGGSQPIHNETGDVWVVFNGEIYNYQELRTLLLSRGHRLSTTSDTETIVHLYEDEGLDFVQHLRGMFGIAIWDERRRRLVLARDRIGEKPLYYLHDGERLLFGSEIKAILQGYSAREADPQAVADFLACGYVAGSRTFFRGIAKLPPAHMLVAEEGRELQIKRYWQHWESIPGEKPSFAEASEGVVRKLDEAVQLCLKSDVEVGAFLSGGIDSSVIVALMRRLGVRVQTFSVGYKGEAEGFNELQHAKLVADHLGTIHHELILSAQSSMELLPKILWHYDEPHGEPTSVLVYLLCQFTRQTVKVALGGTGGDEIFFGYPRHAGIRMLERYRRFPAVLRKHVIERVVARWPESTRGSRFAKRAKRFISGADLPPEEAYLTWVSLIHPNLRAELLEGIPKWGLEDPSGDRFLRTHLLREGRGSFMDRVAGLDIEGYLPEYQLTYMDRMSMAHGLEVRSPLCDYELVEYVTGLPTAYRLKGSRSKHILKEVAKRWIPKQIAERKKVGFDSPIGQWFKEELRGFLLGFLSEQNVRASGLLNPAAVAKMVGEHLAGQKDYSLQLWSLLAVEGWYRMYIEGSLKDGTEFGLRDLRGADSRGVVAVGGRRP